MSSLLLGGFKKSSGTSNGAWCTSAHRLTSSKFLHVCLVLKSTYANGCSLSTHTCPRTATSTVHMSCWRIMSRQCATKPLANSYGMGTQQEKRYPYKHVPGWLRLDSKMVLSSVHSSGRSYSKATCVGDSASRVSWRSQVHFLWLRKSYQAV